MSMLLLGGEAPPTPYPNQYQREVFQQFALIFSNKKAVGDPTAKIGTKVTTQVNAPGFERLSCATTKQYFGIISFFSFELLTANE